MAGFESKGMTASEVRNVVRNWMEGRLSREDIGLGLPEYADRLKAQEIQGAILLIAEKHRRDKPFLGVILAGEFTENSVEQLKSLGFLILHIPYFTIVDAFSSVDINADFDETTADKEFQYQVNRIESMKQEERRALQDKLDTDCGPLINQFFIELVNALDRAVIRVMILPLSGEEHLFQTLVAAERFVDKFNEERTSGTFLKHELKEFLTYVGR